MPGNNRFIAFWAGLIIACLAFWMLSDTPLPNLRALVELELRQEGPDARPTHTIGNTGGIEGSIDQPVLPRVEARPAAGPNGPGTPGGRGLAGGVESALAQLWNLALWGQGASLDPGESGVWSITLDVSRPSSPAPAASAELGPRLRSAFEVPKLAIVIDDLGLDAQALQQLLALDYPVSCAFLPHGAHTRSGAEAAHAKGLEILVHQPMEPVGYPRVRPGPNSLMNGMSESQIRRILEASIAAVPHAAGLNNHMGSRFTQQAEGVNAVIRLLKERGMFMLDSLTHRDSVFAVQGRRMGIEHYSRTVFLDVSPSREKILEELRSAERIALLTGRAVAIGHPLPETLAALGDWQRLRNPEVRVVKLQELGQDGQ